MQTSSRWLTNGAGSNWSQWQLMSRKSSSSKNPHNFQRSIIAECRNWYSAIHGQFGSSFTTSEVQPVWLHTWMSVEFIFAKFYSSWCCSLERIKLFDSFTLIRHLLYQNRLIRPERVVAQNLRRASSVSQFHPPIFYFQPFSMYMLLLLIFNMRYDCMPICGERANLYCISQISKTVNRKTCVRNFSPL